MGQNQNRKISLAGSGLLFMMCLVTLMFFGILANSILVSVKTTKSDSSSGRICSVDIRTLPDSDGSMNKNGSTSADRIMHITIPACISAGGFDKRRPVQKIIEIKTAPRIISGRFADLSHAVTICPHKSHEFTLVGAKPSGTS